MREATKEEFKTLFFRFGGPYTGWTPEYWEQFFEREAKPGMRYMIEEPASPAHTRMNITTDFGAREHRLYFMTEESEDSLYESHDDD